LDYFQRRANNKGTRLKEIADVLFAQTCCTRVECLSVYDTKREFQNDTAGSEEFRIREGYGLLFQQLSQDLPIKLEACVEKIEWKKGLVNAHLQNGQVLKSKRCLITVPIGVLQSQAIDSFVMEAATKLIYEFSEKLWSNDLVYMCHTGLAPRWWTPTYGRDSSTHPICCYVTSQRATTIDSMSEHEALQTGLKELSTLLDVSIHTLNDKLVTSQRVSWANERFTRGGYAAVPPGKSNARVDLAVPVEDTLFFSGEVCMIAALL
jgi:monoamine oxidase